MSKKDSRFSMMVGFLIVTLLFSALISPAMVHGAEEKEKEEEKETIDLAPDAKSAILMDMDTGTVLYEKNSGDVLPPASITKIMTMILIMEAVQADKITWNDTVRVSEKAASMGGSQIFLEPGEEMSVEDLMKGIAIASGNDATVALAEHIAGSEEQFVKMMNDKGQELGLENTHFENTNGLPTEGHTTTARDIAVMSRELMKYEEITRFTSLYEDYLRQETDKPFWLVNTNRMVKFYDGMDGLKTGYTREAKYCLAATAKRDDMRLIAVVMGTPTAKDRNQNMTQMLDYAFSQYETHPIYEPGHVLDSVNVDKGEKTEMDLVVPHQVSILSRKGESREQYQTELVTEIPEAPVQVGDTIAHLHIKKDGEVQSTVDITATEEVARASWWQLFKRTTSSVFR